MKFSLKMRYLLKHWLDCHQTCTGIPLGYFQEVTVLVTLTVLRTYASSADPVQMPHSAASGQDQHCLLTGIFMQNTIKVKAFTKKP